MTEIEVLTKKWGSSLGLIIPKRIVERDNLKPNEAIMIEIKKSVCGREIWGLFPSLKIDTQKAKDEMRKGWD